VFHWVLLFDVAVLPVKLTELSPKPRIYTLPEEQQHQKAEPNETPENDSIPPSTRTSVSRARRLPTLIGALSALLEMFPA
jgi:hypothetical protein